MEDHCFKFCTELAITSEVVSVEDITDLLGITPHRFFRKGDLTRSKYTTRVGVKPYHLWAFSSKTYISRIPVAASPDINGTLAEIRSILSGKESVLHGLIKDSRFHVGLWIWVETDGPVIHVDIQNENIRLLGLTSNVHFTLLFGSEIQIEGKHF